VQDNRYRPGRGGGVWYRRTGVWMRCPGEEERWGLGGTVYIHAASMTPEKVHDCNYKLRCVKPLQSGILGIIQGKHRLARKTQSAKLRPVACITAAVARAGRGERGFPAPTRNHKTNIGLPDAGNRRLNRRGERDGGNPFRDHTAQYLLGIGR